MENILCYGDSNTFGYNPQDSSRFDTTVRWPKLLSKLLGDGYSVVEEGLNGRTTVFEDPILPARNGRRYLVPCIRSHQPLDLVIIMLGTNDLKTIFVPSAYSISRGMEELIKVLKNPYNWDIGTPPNILLISPILIGENIANSHLYNAYGDESIRLSRQFADIYRLIAEKYCCLFLDAALHACPSSLDSVHMDADSHRSLAKIVSEVILSTSLKSKGPNE